jgi:hypothetical protein
MLVSSSVGAQLAASQEGLSSIELCACVCIDCFVSSPLGTSSSLRTEEVSWISTSDNPYTLIKVLGPRGRHLF